MPPLCPQSSPVPWLLANFFLYYVGKPLSKFLVFFFYVVLKMLFKGDMFQYKTYKTVSSIMTQPHTSYCFYEIDFALHVYVTKPLYNELGTVSITIGAVCSQKLKLCHLQNFKSEWFVEYLQCIEITFVLENTRACYKYRIQNRSNYLDFSKIHWILCYDTHLL
jgi:hypothetical protein